MMTEVDTSNRRSLDRTVTLTDAVVAIAMTLLVLPLVELAAVVDPNDLSELLDDHLGVFIGFALSFLVIYQFWAAHERVLAQPCARAPRTDLPIVGQLRLPRRNPSANSAPPIELGTEGTAYPERRRIRPPSRHVECIEILRHGDRSLVPAATSLSLEGSLL